MDNSKKYKIALAVLAAVTVIAVVGGFVAAFHINSSTLEKIIKKEHVVVKSKEGKTTDEHIEIDETDNIAKFQVGDDKATFNVIQDYGRKLVIVEYPNAVEPTCLVSVFNTSNSASDLEQMKGVINDGGTKPTTFVQQKTAIANVDFLPADAQKMCKGHNVYWATEDCDDGATETTGELDAPHREKRDAGCLYCHVAPDDLQCYPYCLLCFYYYCGLFGNLQDCIDCHYMYCHVCPVNT